MEYIHFFFLTFQFSSVAQSCLTLRDPMNHSTPGLPIHHQLPEFTQTHVHWVGDAIQPSCPLLSPYPTAFNLSQNQGLFQCLPKKSMKHSLKFLVKCLWGMRSPVTSSQFSLVAQSRPTLCEPMDCSTPGFLVHQQLLTLLKLMSVESVMPPNHLILCQPLSFCLQSFPASGSFQMSQFFVSGGQSIGISTSASVL